MAPFLSFSNQTKNAIWQRNLTNTPTKISQAQTTMFLAIVPDA